MQFSEFEYHFGERDLKIVDIWERIKCPVFSLTGYIVLRYVVVTVSNSEMW